MNSPMVCDESVLVVVGGMGPMAGIECYKYVLENTTTNGTDQDNLNSLIISYPRNIGNRVDYVLGKSCKNPGESVLDFLQPQLECLVRTYKRVVIGVACITFHCPSVFSVFQQGVKSRFPEVELVSIISATVEFVRTLYPHLKRVGIMSTDGTRHARPFEDDMSKQGISLVYLNDDQQSIITSCIFNEQWGAKSQTFDRQYVHSKVCSVMDELIEENCDAILLGCTEIPLAISESVYRGIPILNPSWIMARRMIQLVDPSKLKPLQN